MGLHGESRVGIATLKEPVTQSRNIFKKARKNLVLGPRVYNNRNLLFIEIILTHACNLY